MKYFFQDVDRNWRTGNYQIKIAPWDRNYQFRFKIEGDYLLCHRNRINQFRIFHRRSMTWGRVRRFDVNHLIQFINHLCFIYILNFNNLIYLSYHLLLIINQSF